MFVEADVPVAVVEWPGSEPPVVYVHATGFHKMVWRKLARLVGRRAVAMDLRGHGDSGKPPDDYTWWHFAEEILAVVDQLELPTPIDGVGHSSGAAALLLAELARPGLFRRLVVFEPIVFPAPLDGAHVNPLADPARRRRMLWPSPEAAAENYLSKPPMNRWDREVMDDYVRHGMFERSDGQWELKCPGELEAQVYENSGEHGAWDRLADIHCPTLVVRGGAPGALPGELAAEQAERLADGHLTDVAGGGHFSPQEQPEEAARVIREFLER
jgi:pimeloyl-ACP methyl ester carboxylesterase